MASFFLGGVKTLLLRLLVVGAVLVLGYFFVAKPLLDEAQDSATGVQGVVESVTDAIDSESIGSAVDRVRSEIGGGLSEQDARRLVACMRQAEGDRERMRRCARRFGPD